MEATRSSSVSSKRQKKIPVDWSVLPADIVAVISKKLHDLFDFVYFRAVCKNWRTATSISDLPPQLPWVLECHDNGYLHVHSIISGKTRTIRCPKTPNMCLYGPSYGYLYGNIGNRKKCLLNPLSNEEVPIEFEKDFRGMMLCMSPDLLGSYDHIVFFDDSKLGFYQPSIREWCYVDSPVDVIWPSETQTCSRGYYIIDPEGGDTVVTDIASRSSFSVPSPHDFNELDDVYFVESAGKILKIVKRFDCCSVSSNFNYSFKIYQLDGTDKNCGYRWLKTSSIGNQILFLDDGCDGISIAACESTGLMGNCIYCLERCDDGLLDSEVEVYRYNIEDGQTEKISSRFNHTSNWFVPRIVGSLSVDPR